MTDRRKAFSVPGPPRVQHTRRRIKTWAKLARPLTHEQAAQTEQDQARLVAENSPQQPGGMVAMNFAERFTCGGIQQIDQIRVMLLIKMVHGAADQPVSSELAAQRTQFAAVCGTEQHVGYTLRAAEAGDDASDSRDFYLRGGVSDQKNFAVADAAFDRNPLLVNRNARALPLQGFERSFLQEALNALLGLLAAAFADDAKGASRFVFGDEPVKVGSVVGHEPDASGVGAQILGQCDDSLHQRNRFDGRPTGSAAHPSSDAIGADHGVGVEFIAAASGFHFQTQATRIRTEAKEARVERKSGASFYGLRR